MKYASGIRIICFLILYVVYPLSIYAQRVTPVATLHSSVRESSGLIYLNQRLVTHNDSNGEAALYEIDNSSGNVTRRVIISNAENIDWEDICNDDKYIYIGDFGNNKGNRTDLKVYKLLIADYLNTSQNTLTAETIHFSYADQTDFSAGDYNTNFDAEALISFNDSLYIFTKNWTDLKTNVYALPKNPGTYQISKVDGFDVQGLISGAAYNARSGSILLTGYTSSQPFIVKLSGYNKSRFFSGSVERHTIQPQGSYQIEGITPIDENQYYITSEENALGKSTLYSLTMDIVLGIKPLKTSENLLYPNPASDFIHIPYDDLLQVEFYTPQGQLVKSSIESNIRISELRKGMYILIIKRQGREKKYSQKLVII
jgi:hypothetical protein